MTTGDVAKQYFRSGIEAEAAGDLPRVGAAYEEALGSLGDAATWESALLNAQLRGVLRSIDRRLDLPESPFGLDDEVAAWTDALASLTPADSVAEAASSMLVLGRHAIADGRLDVAETTLATWASLSDLGAKADDAPFAADYGLRVLAADLQYAQGNAVESVHILDEVRSWVDSHPGPLPVAPLQLVVLRGKYIDRAIEANVDREVIGRAWDEYVELIRLAYESANMTGDDQVCFGAITFGCKALERATSVGRRDQVAILHARVSAWAAEQESENLLVQVNRAEIEEVLSRVASA